MKQFLTISNILTLIRLIVSPIMLPVLIVYLLPFNTLWINICLAVLFMLFGLTDFLDGFLARWFKQTTALGKVLDPIADKFLVYSTFVALLAIHKIYFFWVLIFIGREFFMLGLRQLALENDFSIAVSWLGKIKTFLQLVFLAVLIANPCHSMKDAGILTYVNDIWTCPDWMVPECLLLILTLFLTIFSAYQYYRSFMYKYMQKLSLH